MRSLPKIFGCLLAFSLIGSCNRSQKPLSYRDHFQQVSGYTGPLSEFNFCYSRPVEFYTIGWIKVKKSEISFKNESSLDSLAPSKADENFYFFKEKVICPQPNHRYLNWSREDDLRRILFAYDLDDEFLWFVEDTDLK